MTQIRYCTQLPSELNPRVPQVAMLPMQNALYQAAVNNFRSQAAAARRKPAPKSGTFAALRCHTATLTMRDLPTIVMKPACGSDLEEQSLAVGAASSPIHLMWAMGLRPGKAAAAKLAAVGQAEAAAAEDLLKRMSAAKVNSVFTHLRKLAQVDSFFNPGFCTCTCLHIFSILFIRISLKTGFMKV